MSDQENKTLPVGIPIGIWLSGRGRLLGVLHKDYNRLSFDLLLMVLARAAITPIGSMPSGEPA
jgi:hypothetical protein